MTKIIIVTCIVAAVCVFQTAEAGLFDPKSIGSLLGNVKDQVPNSLENAQDVANKVLGSKSIVDSLLDNVKDQVSNSLGNAQDVTDKVKNGLQKRVQTPECIKAYEEIQEAVTNLIKNFNVCVSNQTYSVSDQVQNLRNAVNDLKTNVTQLLQESLTCLQHPLNIITCVQNFPKDLGKLTPQFRAVVNVAYGLIRFFPSVGACYQKAFHAAIDEDANTLIKDGQQCVTSILKPLIPFS